MRKSTRSKTTRPIHTNGLVSATRRKGKKLLKLALGYKMLKGSLSGLKDNVTDKTSDILTYSLKTAKNRGKKISRYIARKPYRTLALAAFLTSLCVGYVIRK